MSPKTRTRFLCQECGYEAAAWLGRCPDCGSWNSMREEELARGPRRGITAAGSDSGGTPLPLTEVSTREEERLPSGIGELDRILGGGLVPGSVILLGGDPGIGKSTLLLQASEALATGIGREDECAVLYVSGEESARQTRMRAERLKISAANLFVLCETNLDAVERHCTELSPRVIVVDSIQTMYRPETSSAPGSVSQVRECAASMIYLAKRRGATVFLVGHVTKEGAIAGPRVLEHMVDTVLYFEGEVHDQYRLLRTVKNRFGPTNEIGIFEMGDRGLQPVDNPSRVLLEERAGEVPGSAVVPCIEGTRPLLVEVQALVTPTSFGMPRRRVSGADYNRASLLFAVLEKRGGIILHAHDIFVNVVGGVKLQEPASDLAIALAVASSLKEKPVRARSAVFGELGLGGEVRAVNQSLARIRECARLGFDRCILSQHNVEGIEAVKGIETIGVRMLGEALEAGLNG